MWQVGKKISAHISHERAKAYRALVGQHCSMSDLPTGKDGPGDGSSKMAEAEEQFHKSISKFDIHCNHRGCQGSWGTQCGIDI